MLKTHPTLKRPAPAAEHFSVSQMTLWRWSKQEGFPPVIKRAGVVLYNIDAINDWLFVDQKEANN